MAKINSAWGLDIGTDSLKVARVKTENGEILFDCHEDYVYPKGLWCKDVVPEEMIDEAIGHFLDTKEVIKGEPIVINIPTRFGMMRFFSAPPIPADKIKDMVRHEARQQIPFDLDDVVFEAIQTRGECVEGFLMESEFVIVSAKIDTVEQRLSYFKNYRDLRVTQAVLEPFAILTALEHQHNSAEIMIDMRPLGEIEEAMGVISMGSECTTMMFTRVSDGGIVRPMWVSDIPLGGVHWTKQLAKELKLTWAKAEHLKRNVVEAEDAKAVIQAMRPVYEDFITEVKRRIQFFMNTNRQCSISRFILLGDSFLLPGLVAYLGKDIGKDIGCPVQMWEPKRLIAFGLALQGLGYGENLVNLIPTKPLFNLDLGWVKRLIPRVRNPFVWDR